MSLSTYTHGLVYLLNAKSILRKIRSVREQAQHRYTDDYWKGE